MRKPAYNEPLRHLRELVPDEGDQRYVLALYADSLGLTEKDIKTRFPGFDVALSLGDFEDALAYFCQDLLVDRVGKKAATQRRFNATVDEVVRAMISGALRSNFITTIGTA